MNDAINQATKDAAHIEVYTDGQCPLCRWVRAHVEPYDLNACIVWRDYNDPEILRRAAPHTLEEMAAEMHARNSRGQWSKGYAAWLEVLRVLPRWRVLVRPLSIWPFTAIGPVFYKWIARRRYKLFGVPPPCDAGGVCSLHAHQK